MRTHRNPEDSAPAGDFCGRTRREFLWQAGAGFTALGLVDLLSGDRFFNHRAGAADAAKSANPLAPRPPHFAPKAKSVIFLFMYGGPSQVDTFDYKPKLYELDGQTIPVKTFGRGGKKDGGRVVGPKWKFKQYGQSGKYVSDLFPHLATCVDDIAFLHSMTADSPIHGSAMLQMNTGKILSGSPCIGSWANYGLGSVNEDLPGFVVMLDPTGGPISGRQELVERLHARQLPGDDPPVRRASRPRPQAARRDGRGRDPAGDARRPQRLQQGPPRGPRRQLEPRRPDRQLRDGLLDAEARPGGRRSDEGERGNQSLYGLDKDETEDFGRRCLLARRLVERGVRFVQLYSGGAHNDSNWDAHGDLEKNHNYHAGRTDKPIAGLLKDLKRRGLLDETLVIWGGEFGRQPTAEYAKGTGRDHNAYGFTMWMAGGGIKGGVSVGETDELGAEAVSDRFHVKHLHATVLHQLGLDPNRLSYFYNGLDQKLVGVEGAEPIKQIIA